MTNKLNIGALKDFADELKKNPSILFEPQLFFLREALSVFGELKEPKKANTSQSNDHSHDHSHDHAHSGYSHDHSHHGCSHDEKKTEKQAKPETVDESEDKFVEEEDPERMSEDPEPFLVVPDGGEDWEGAAQAKEKANEAKANGDYDGAISFFTEAMKLGQVSALTLANRAECLLKLRKPRASISDCTAAIALNPDSAKALRCRGKALRFLGRWEESNINLSAAQRIDFDPDVQELQKFVTGKTAQLEAHKTKLRLKEEQKNRERLLRRKAEIEEAKKRAAEEERARQEEEDDAEDVNMGDMGGIPGMGGMGGMDGMGGMGGQGMQQMLMQLIMQDPELAAGMQNPKLMAAFTSIMSSGGLQSPKLQEAMKDPEVKSFIEKVQKKLGPIMGMMGGAGAAGKAQREEEDEMDMPDLD